MKKLALAIAISAVATQASAAAWDLSQINIVNNGNGGDATLGGQLGFTDDGASNMTSNGGVTTFQSFAGPTWLNTVEITDWAISNTGIASASAYNCVEGLFGGYVGASICGNYNFQGDGDDSTLVYGPGTDVALTLGGNDTASGPVQSIDTISNLQPWFGAGLGIFGQDYLAFTTRTIAGDQTLSGDGSTIVFTSAVPVPAAAWLFGSALVGLAGVGRKRKMA